jgi:hypothetical protein
VFEIFHFWTIWQQFTYFILKKSINSMSDLVLI